MKEKIENTIEKIGDTVLGKELESEIGKVEQKQESKKVEQEETGEKKNINQRIEDLVNEMEKTNSLIAKVFSLKSAFIRGLFWDYYWFYNFSWGFVLYDCKTVWKWFFKRCSFG